MTKKDFTADAASVFVDAMITPTAPKTEQPKQTANRREQPKAKASSAPAEPQPEVKVTFRMGEPLYNKLRYFVFTQRTTLKAVLIDALTDYIAKYERKNGKLNIE